MQNLSLFESYSQPFTINNHLSLNFNAPVNNHLTRFHDLIDTKSYTPITNCTLEHTLTATSFTNREKLYCLLTDSLALISKNSGGARSIALAGEDWGQLLNCSRSSVFIMQKSLEDKGYFNIKRDWNRLGLNNRNLITPILPSSVFNHLNEKYPDRVGEHTPYNPLVECKRAYLDRTKLFIRLNYNLLRIITSYQYINSLQKVLWLGSFVRGYKNYMLEAKEGFNRGGYGYSDDSYSCYDDSSSYSNGNYNNGSSFSFVASYKELAEQYSCSTKELSKSIRALEKLGFIKAQNFYIRKKGNENNNGNDGGEGSDDACASQERQDQFLWKITVCIPEDCMLELTKVKDRSNLKDCFSPKPKGIDYMTNPTTAVTENITLPHTSRTESCSKSYINSVMEELDVDNTSRDAKQYEKSKLENYPAAEDPDFLLSNPTQTLLPSLISLSSAISLYTPADTPVAPDTFTNVDKIHENNDVAKYDPDVAKSRLLLIKDPLLKINSKSNLGEAPKVLFDDFLKGVKSDDVIESIGSKEKDKETVKEDAGAGLKLGSKVAEWIGEDAAAKVEDRTEKEVWERIEKKLAEGLRLKGGNVSERKVKIRDKEFNIHSELIRAKLAMLPKDKADEARCFAYSLVSKKLACGTAASLTKHELAKQLIHHAATWKPTKLGSISREKEIDTALSVAWRAIVAGTWQVPLELARAQMLQYEFEAYRRKYQESGIVAYEVSALELDVNKMLGGWCDLKGKITDGVKVNSDDVRSRFNTWGSDKERKMRTRHLIEVGGLATKAGLDYLPTNTLYGALLSIALSLETNQTIKDEWTKIGKTKLDQEQTNKHAVILKFEQEPSIEIRKNIREHGLRWNKLRKEWYGYCASVDSLKNDLSTSKYNLEQII